MLTSERKTDRECKTLGKTKKTNDKKQGMMAREKYKDGN
jgi:hypothetical protein